MPAYGNPEEETTVDLRPTTCGDAEMTSAISGLTAIRLDRDGAVAIITLAREERLNAISRILAEEVLAVIRDLELDGDARAVVITGAGRAFCAGADLTNAAAIVDSRSTMEYLQFMGDFFAVIRACSLPIVAAIGGLAFGGGFELAMSCDFRIASRDSVLCLPEIGIGAVPSGGGLTWLSQLVGLARAKELVLLGRRVDADTALGYGLVTEVVEPGEQVNAAIALAAQIAAKPPLAVRLAKRALDVGASSGSASASLIEFLTAAALFPTEDRREGMQAFVDHRLPEFRGR